MPNESFEQKWEHFFKPEVRNAGRGFFEKGVVTSSQPSDTEVTAYVRGSTSQKVIFKSASVEDKLVTVSCNCSHAKKGQLCKHAWAVLLKIENDHPDFLEGKQDIEKLSDSAQDDNSSPAQKFSKNYVKPSSRPLSQAQIDSQEAMKAKQNDYRKQQYQKQKQKIKDIKQAKKKTKFEPPPPSYPKNVEIAVEYFEQNGFPINAPFDLTELGLAKKKLSRIFHPDKGGSHDEIVELNLNFDVLVDFVKDR
ncbi:MAG: SWIM zinc finger family protein [Bdellovibrionota bacterium]